MIIIREQFYSANSDNEKNKVDGYEAAAGALLCECFVF